MSLLEAQDSVPRRSPVGYGYNANIFLGVNANT